MRKVRTALLLVLLTSLAFSACARKPSVAIVVGSQAAPLEHFAASELQSYLKRLYGIGAVITHDGSQEQGSHLLVGSPQSNPAVMEAMGEEAWPALSDQGILIRPARWKGQVAAIVGGGSPVATMWAAYELVEQWGVRYLLHGDVFPDRPGTFRLPEKATLREPKFQSRTWRLMNDFAMGPESWGLADNVPFINQLAKQKINRVFLAVYPWQPFVHVESRGVARKQAWLWYDYHYPITDDMPGRKLFVNAKEFWNPDLPLNASYDEFKAAGKKLCEGIIQHAKSRGMQVGMTASLVEFPKEFVATLPGSQIAHQLGELMMSPGPNQDVDDPVLADLAGAVLTSTLNTYPQLDFFQIGMPEHRGWVGHYEKAWKKLNARYQLDKVLPLKDALSQAARRTGYPGGAKRALDEVKGDIVALYFYDKLFNDLKLVQKSKNPTAKLCLNSVAEELFPVLGRLLPPGTELLNFVDYTASRIVKRREVLKNIPARNLPSSLILTLQDDNVGVLPQITTGSIHELAGDIKKYGWQGFTTRYWMISDQDPCAAYLARSSWEEIGPEEVYRDLASAVNGPNAVEEMLAGFRGIEKVTLSLHDHGLGLTFPVPKMIMKFWKPGTLSRELAQDRKDFRQVQAHFKAALNKSRPQGRAYAQYWVDRCEFAIGYIDTIEAVLRAASLEQTAKDAEAKKDQELASKSFMEAAEQAQFAFDSSQKMLETMARAAQDQSDRGALATMVEYIYRPLKAETQRLTHLGRH